MSEGESQNPEANATMNMRLVIYAALFLILMVSWGASCFIYRAAEMGDRVAPLETRAFDRITVVAVGTGSAYENPDRLGPCTAVALGDEIVLVDAGRGTAAALRAASIPVAQPRTIVLTSLLPESTLGLYDLLYTGWLRGRSERLRILGPPGTRAFVAALESANQSTSAAIGSALALPAAGIATEVSEIADAASFTLSLGDLELRAAELGGGPVPALAWRFARLGRSVVVAGPGWAPDALVTLAQDASLLVHEAVYVPTAADAEAADVELDLEALDRERVLHTSIEEVGELAERASVRSLALIRMRPPPMFSLQMTSIVERDFAGEIVIPEDGDELIPD